MADSDDKSSEADSEKKFTFFGRNLEEIPCFKKSFTVGISSGIVLGLTNFLFTSRVKRSTDVAVYSFVLTTLCFWCHCRYQWSKEKFFIQQAQYAMEQAMLYEGTDKDVRNKKERLD